MGLDRSVKLSRPEWAAVRGALGRPRRLSQAFLRQERVRLEAHRAAVRAKYEEVRISMPARTCLHTRTSALYGALIIIHTVKSASEQRQSRAFADCWHRRQHDWHRGCGPPRASLPALNT